MRRGGDADILVFCAGYQLILPVVGHGAVGDTLINSVIEVLAEVVIVVVGRAGSDQVLNRVLDVVEVLGAGAFVDVVGTVGLDEDRGGDLHLGGRRGARLEGDPRADRGGEA